MTSSTSQPTTSARTASFLAACAVALVSGTPYLYSTYANQLTTKLALTAVQSSLVAAGVHYGLFLSGPLFGRIVDSQGPRTVGCLAAALLVAGYSGLSWTYSGAFGSFGFFTAFLFLILVGMGSQAGYMTSVSTNAHNFQSARGIAMGVPIAGFGLSALLFAQISSHWYKDDTQAFLFLVAKAIGSTILISLIFLKVFPSEDLEANKDQESIAHAAGSSSSSSSSSSLDDDDITEEEAEHRRRTAELERLIAPKHDNSASHGHSSSHAIVPKSLSGFKMFRMTHHAQLLMLGTMLLSGPGLMYITNAGNVIRSIYRDHMDDPSKPPTDEDLIRLQQLQNFHVSLISLMSCIGRISIGMMSDLGKRGGGKWWGISRVGFLLYAGVCVWLGQTFGARVQDIEDLVRVSLLVGLGYGSVFGVAPAIVSEWFHVSNFGTNWGWMSVTGAIGGQVFNLIFGWLYDVEAQHEHTLECFGTECFHKSFVVGSISSFIGLSVLIYLAILTRRPSSRC
ncbi:major facilitator superfamily domain-containing protein [Linnemannia elongata]|nr:major facilitator superfamily domain-containing protein [Linnemannia elongata]